jgi:tetratricopeptide (TPR) repeat protein
MPLESANSLHCSAALLAQKGLYTEAMTELSKALEAGHCSQPQALDLRARIFAQQGYFLKAEKCWQEACLLDPTNPSYEEALTALRRPRSHLTPLVANFTRFTNLLFQGILLIGLLVGYRNVQRQQDILLQKAVSLEERAVTIETQLQASHERMIHDLALLPTTSHVDTANTSLTKQVSTLRRQLLSSLSEQQDIALANRIEAQEESRSNLAQLENSLLHSHQVHERVHKELATVLETMKKNTAARHIRPNWRAIASAFLGDIRVILPKPLESSAPSTQTTTPPQNKLPQP